MKQVAEDRWVPTTCLMCYSCCGVMVQVIDGVVVDIRGNPDHPHSQGKICAKGKAGIMGLYDPYRLTKPLKRTNPEKGLGVDPGWEMISWEEALDLMEEKLRKVKAEDARKFFQLGLDFQTDLYRAAFSSAFGSGNVLPGPSSYYCGPAVHMTMYLTTGAFYVEPDLHHCQYLLMVGNQEGFMVNKNALTATIRMAELRAKGARIVSVDPVCNVGASKADEWIPIRPGTDAAFALALINELVNELGIYDAQFIKSYTNGPYLVGPDGLFVRDSLDKPFLWDTVEVCPKPYDAAEIKDPALLGTYQVNGVECRPAFQLLKEHVKKYTPEAASEITTIPAETIRRIAREFGEAARIGSTIVLDGVEFPYRPATSCWTRGAAAHKHGGLAIMSLQTLNAIVGSIDVPGGTLGNKTVTPFGRPGVAADGMIYPSANELIHLPPFPGRDVKAPETPTLIELFPVSSALGVHTLEEGMLNQEKFGLPYIPEVAIRLCSNMMMSGSNPVRTAEVLKKIPFMVSISIYLDETAQFADLVLPDAHYLEALGAFVNIKGLGLASGPSPYYWSFRQPVLRPKGEARPWIEVYLELADRLDMREDFYVVLNTWLGLKPPNRLDTKKRHTWEEIVDIWAKGWFGPEHDLKWFQEKGVLVQEKKIEDAYPRPFLKGRLPIYLEHWQRKGQELAEVTEKMGLEWDTSDYKPLLDWKPCPAYEEKGDGYDLFAVNYKLTFHNFSNTPENAWLNEIGEHHLYCYKLVINADTAARKGIRDGDLVWVESRAGKVKGKVKASQCIHPEVVAIAGTFGHWSDAMPIAKGKGVHFNSLLHYGLDYVDMITTGQDACVKVKVYKVKD